MRWRAERRRIGMVLLLGGCDVAYVERSSQLGRPTMVREHQRTLRPKHVRTESQHPSTPHVAQTMQAEPGGVISGRHAA